jgi:hypothetical protein
MQIDNPYRSKTQDLVAEVRAAGPKLDWLLCLWNVIHSEG